MTGFDVKALGSFHTEIFNFGLSFCVYKWCGITEVMQAYLSIMHCNPYSCIKSGRHT